MKTKKRYSAAAAALLISVTAAACSNESANSPAASPAQTSGAQKTAAPAPGAFDKKMTIKMFNNGFNPGSPLPAREQDPLRQMLEKAVNVDLEVTIPPADQKAAKLNTMIAGGDTPDLIFMGDRNTAIQYYNQGVTIDLDSYLSGYPNLTKRFTDAQWESMKYKGKTMGVPGYDGVDGIQSWWIRNDWLTKLNLKAPSTPDELMNVMKAFTFNDPDGNNKNDTYGFVAGVGKDGELLAGWNLIMLMFGVQQSFVEVVDGKLNVAEVDPRMKEAVAYMNQMIEAKVVDPDWVSVSDGPAADKKMYGGKVGILGNDWRRMEPSAQDTMKQVGGEVPDWIVIAPPKGPHGDQWVGLRAYQSNRWAISKNAAKDPDKVKRILALLEYWYTDKEAAPYFSYGLKGSMWDMVDGKPKKLVMDKETTASTLWATNWTLPRRGDDPVYFNYLNPKTDGFHAINLKYIKPNAANPYVGPDPADTLSTERRKFINEQILKFITGKEPISNWESSYVNVLNTKFEMQKYKDLTTKQLQEAGIMK